MYPPIFANVLDPKARQDILDSLMDAQNKASSLANKTRRVVDQGLFHLMQRANYSHKNLGHFGLNLDAYAHFTSPIRRYPDLMAHRQLKSMIRGDDWVYDEEETADIAEHCSNQSVIAKYHRMGTSRQCLSYTPSAWWRSRLYFTEYLSTNYGEIMAGPDCQSENSLGVSRSQR